MGEKKFSQRGSLVMRDIFAERLAVFGLGLATDAGSVRDVPRRRPLDLAPRETLADLNAARRR